MQQRETPIFFDRSGKRWIVTENVIVLVVAVVGILVYWLVPLVITNRQPPLLPTATATTFEHNYENKDRPTASQLMDRLAAKNTAVIGSGPFVRLVELHNAPEGRFAIDPFSQKTVHKLSERESQYINGDNYAIQRYGDTRERQIFLTFDDGPDATYSPALLDLLSRESAPSTFFVAGSGVASFPDIAKRMVDEGHIIGNHTFSHIDFYKVGNFRGEQEINQTQRMIIAATGHETAYFRPPYGGNTDQSLRNGLKSILAAQQLGYTIVSYDFDSNDWHFPEGVEPTYPELDGDSKVILLHDGGGDRTQTFAYVEELIRQAKSKGYNFATIDDIAANDSGNKAAAATLADHASLTAAQAALVWPRQLIRWLFIFSVGSLVVISLLNIVLAIIYRFKTKYKTRSKKYSPHVTVILPAYNEEAVIKKSVQSLVRSNYHKISIVIVDDGSSDDTWAVAQSLERRYKRVSAIHQKNAGKAAALNNAISRSSSDIIICVDADTLFPPQTISNLVRHFENETVGAVAGVVKVGNPNGILTKWQALEYVSGISIERNAQALLGAIMIVPGACGAWRRSTLQEVGGFSSNTLAEDCDLALKIQGTKHYRILQDNEAISYTEAPQSLMALTKQRFRWTFGTMQSLWKHRHMVGNEQHGWLGVYVMPSAIIAIAVPILFWPLIIILTIINILSGNYEVILLFFALSLTAQMIISLIGVVLAKERYSYLLAVPFARFAYGPIRMYILYKTILTILKGVDVGWNKLTRTGTAHDPMSANLTLAPIARTRKT